MIALSPGLIQGCVELLGLVARTRLSIPEIRFSFASFGGLAASEVIQTAQTLNWVTVSDESIAVATVLGRRLLSAPNYELMLRHAILDYVEMVRPPWLQAAVRGRARVLAFAGTKVAQVMVEAGLKSDSAPDVVSFWDELAARARGQRSATLTAIGRLGERLSLDYEKIRTGKSPKWISIEDNDDGYDILSIKEKEDSRPLSIETKTSTAAAHGQIHMTRNEWERALVFDCHYFHLWDVSDETAPRLAIVPPDDMRTHIPKDSGNGEWEMAKIPFSAFASYFANVDVTPIALLSLSR